MPNNPILKLTWDYIGNIAMDIFWTGVLFLIGMVAIRIFVNLFKKALLKSKIDVTLHTFILSIAKIFLIVLLSISCLAFLNIPTTPLITALGSVGLALSLALKDSLSNLAGGVVVLFTKPFALGNYIEGNDFAGTVSEIGLAYTILNTVDNKRVYVPNGDMAKAKITNYSAEPKRRLDLKFSISYHDDFTVAKKLIAQVVERSGFALEEPAPVIRVCEHGNHAIVIICRVWVLTEHYFDLSFYLNEEVKLAFDQHGISIPFNQMDVRIIK